MKDIGIIVATLAALYIVEGMFGRTASMWLATVLLAYCLGVFYGTGREISKQKERDAAIIQASQGGGA